MTEHKTRPAGRVQANRPATSLEYHALLAEDQYLIDDDLVHTRTPLPNRSPVDTYGVVTGTAAFDEAAEYPSDTNSLAGGAGLPSEPVRTATVKILRHSPDLPVAPNPSQPVSRAVGEHRQRALYVDTMTRTFPLGVHRDGQAIPADLDFVDGTHGAHISISGMSGIATKTTYALFLLRSLLYSLPRDRFRSQLRVLVFNVKGEDLLWLDRPNRKLTPEAVQQWQTLFPDRPIGPFPDVGYWAPPSPQAPEVPNTTCRLDEIRPFSWTPTDFCRKGMLGFLISADDRADNHNLAHLADHIKTRLQREHVAHGDGSVTFPSHQTPITDLEQLTEFISTRLETDNDDEHPRWAPRSTHLGTVGAFMRRLRGATAQLKHLIRVNGQEIDPYTHQVTVVDLHRLSDVPQKFVVGVIMDTVHRRKETGERGTMMIVLDELNRYAPKDGNSPIKDTLIDIAQRGRSLGLVLVGCQQSASQVAAEIVGNASIRVAGRLDTGEATSRTNRWLVDLSDRATLLRPGQMIVSQPPVPHPTPIRFPFPCWATREEEAQMPSVLSNIT